MPFDTAKALLAFSEPWFGLTASFLALLHVISFQLHLVCLWADTSAVQSCPSYPEKTNDFQALGLVALRRVLMLWEIWISLPRCKNIYVFRLSIIFDFCSFRL